MSTSAHTLYRGGKWTVSIFIDVPVYRTVLKGKFKGTLTFNAFKYYRILII